jgi:hypothetical protein
LSEDDLEIRGPLDLSHYAGLEQLSPYDRARMARLRGWLNADNWDPFESLAVLSGYDPDFSYGTSASALSLLPGSNDFYNVPQGSRDPDVLRVLDDGVDEQRRDVRGLRLTTMPPEEAIAFALAKKVRIPWLDAALADPLCRGRLPIELHKGLPAERPIQVANRKKARKRWENDDRQVLMQDAGRPAFERLRAAGFEGCTRRDGSIITISVVRVVLAAIRDTEPDHPDLHPAPRTAERYVKKWMTEAQSANAGALSDNAAAHMAK